MYLVKLKLILLILGISFSGLVAQSTIKHQNSKNLKNHPVLKMFTKFGVENGRMPSTNEDYNILAGMAGFEDLAQSLGTNTTALSSIFKLYNDQDDNNSLDQLEKLISSNPTLQALIKLKDKPKKKEWRVDYAKQVRDSYQEYVDVGTLTQAQVDSILTPEFISYYDSLSRESEKMYDSMLGIYKPKKKEKKHIDFIKIMRWLGLTFDSRREINPSEEGTSGLFQASRDYASDRFNFNSYFEFKALNNRSYSEYFNEVITQKELLLHNQRLNRAQYNKNRKCKNIFEEAIQENLNFKLKLNPGEGMSTEQKMKRLDEVENPKLFKKLDRLCPPQSFEPSSFKEIQALLETYEAMVVVTASSEEQSGDIIYTYCIIRVGEKEPSIIKLNEGVKLETSYLKSYKDNIDRSMIPTKVYEYYWKYVDEKLSGISKLYFVADGVYHIVNVSVLPAPEDNLKIISDKYEIVHLMSPSSLRNFKKHNDKICSSMQIYGNFEFGLNRGGRFSFTPNKEPKEEISAILNISSLSGVSEDSIYLIENCTEAAFERESAQVMHFATHSFLDSARFLTFTEDNKLKKSESFFSTNLKFSMGWTTLQESDPNFRSGLALTDANSFTGFPKSSSNMKDGILFSHEIANLDLQKTDLVFMNSCSTDKNDIKNGLGIYGIQRAFFEAGVNSIIMSTSQVSDEVSKMFAQKFYESYFFKRKSKSDAFEDACRFVRYKKDKLSNWGSYRLVNY